MRICKFKTSNKCPNKECSGTGARKSPSCPYMKLYNALEETKAQKRQYYADRPEEHQAYREQNRERAKAWAKNDRKIHPEKYEAYRRNLENVIRASLKNHERRGLKVKVTVEEALEVYRATPHCKYCGREMAPAKGIQETSLSIDRINNEPVLRKDNIQFICHQCNMTKGNRTHEEFVAYMRNVLVILGNQ